LEKVALDVILCRPEGLARSSSLAQRLRAGLNNFAPSALGYRDFDRIN